MTDQEKTIRVYSYQGEDKIKALRLKSVIINYQNERKVLLARRSLSPKFAENLNSPFNALIDQAEKAIKNKNLDLGWRCFHAAKRIDILGFTKPECEGMLSTLSHESSKLNEWRKNSVNKICKQVATQIRKLKKNDQLNEIHYKLFLARKIIDEHYENEYHKINLRRESMKIVRRSLIIILSLLITISLILHLFEDGKNYVIDDLVMVIAVIVFGALGAIFSTAITLTRDLKLNEKIPELLSGSIITSVRPLIGAGAAVAAFLFLNAGLINFDLEDNGKTTMAIVFTISFIAGFSERIVIQAAERFTGSAA